MKYILFDLDGTLVNNREGIVKSVHYALDCLGIYEGEADKLERFIGPPLATSFKEFYDLSDTGVERAVEKYRERFSKRGVYENKLYEMIPELLSELKNTDKILCVSTSKPQKFTDIILEDREIKEYFDVVQGASLDSSLIEKGDIIRETLNQLDSPNKDEIIMIGDRKHDIIGAKQNGIKSVGVYYGFAEENELEDAGADYIVNTVEELIELLLSI